MDSVAKTFLLERFMNNDAHNTTSAAVFWNIWGHRYPGGIHQYIQRLMGQIDVFCFTEVTQFDSDDTPHPHVYTSTNPREPASQLTGMNQLSELMQKQYNAVFHSPTVDNWTCVRTGQEFVGVGFGSALIYRNTLTTITTGAQLIGAEQSIAKPRVVQWIVYEKAGFRYLVAHLHGLWIKENTKGDHPARFQQAREVRQLLQQLVTQYDVNHVVFGGDFNLALETKSLELMLSGEGSSIVYRNLIAEYAVMNTRTPEYRKYGIPGESMHADYVLVSPGVTVHGLQVENHVLASDHAPLIVTFS